MSGSRPACIVPLRDLASKLPLLVGIPDKWMLLPTLPPGCVGEDDQVWVILGTWQPQFYGVLTYQLHLDSHQAAQEYRFRYQLSFAITACFPPIDLRKAFGLAWACCTKGGNRSVARPVCDDNLLIPLDAAIWGPTTFSSGRAIFLHNYHIVYTWRANTPYHHGQGKFR